MSLFRIANLHYLSNFFLNMAFNKYLCLHSGFVMLLNKFEFVDNCKDFTKLKGANFFKITEVFLVNLGMIEV